MCLSPCLSQVRRDATVDKLHGLAIPDPYRWLEDPDSEETVGFVTQQNELFQSVLKQCDTRDQFKSLFEKIFDYPKFGTPFKRGNRYYYYHNSGVQNQYVLYTQSTLDSPATILLDPNTLSADGTVSLGSIDFSEDGSFMSYSLSSGGSDWQTIQVMSINEEGTAGKLEDKLEYVKFSSMAWTHDHKGFFYNTFPKPKSRADLGTETDANLGQQLRFHVLGSRDDPIVYEDPAHPTWMCSADITDCGKYLLLYISEGCQPSNRLYVVDMEKLDHLPSESPGSVKSVDWAAYDCSKKGSKKLPLLKLVDSFDASFSVVANDGPVFLFKTNLRAPKNKLVRVDISSPDLKPHDQWPALVEEHDKDVLQSAVALKGDHLVLRYLHDVRGKLELRSLSTGAFVTELKLPGIGSVSGFSGSRKSTECFFGFSSFAEPGATYRVDLDSGEEPALFRSTELKVPHDPSEFETRQVFVPSKDGTLVPMFITHRKGLVLDGSHPTLLYGYGGFNISLEPGFSASRLAFIKGYDGVFAQANLRGGGEYGREWRDAGSREKKQNVFDDFQACAEFLIRSSYCSGSTLTIQGGSNGGLLVAACANQRPDLYSCVLGQVGVMDMMRFHK
jgi:prolyl oligopeptidase